MLTRKFQNIAQSWDMVTPLKEHKKSVTLRKYLWSGAENPLALAKVIAFILFEEHSWKIG